MDSPLNRRSFLAATTMAGVGFTLAETRAAPEKPVPFQTVDARAQARQPAPRVHRDSGAKSIPITLIIDDPAPCINVYWWHAAEPQGTEKPTLKSGELVVREVPVAFVSELARVLRDWGIKGKFSVLPYPAGLGSIAQGLKGYPKSDVDEWLAVVRREIAPRMDITPEILTHAKALDLATHTLLPENESVWSAHQTEATLTPYIACALEILNAVGLPATGVTSPWDFGAKVEPAYQLAILNAQRKVNGRTRTWYFLHSSSELAFQSKVVHRDSDGWLVSIVAQSNDLLWQTMETQETSQAYVNSVADQLLTEDGQRGRAAELFHTGVPVVLLTHWQSLFANGRKTGLRVLAEGGRRVRAVWGKRVRWVTCLELASEIADGRWG